MAVRQQDHWELAPLWDNGPVVQMEALYAKPGDVREVRAGAPQAAAA